MSNREIILTEKGKKELEAELVDLKTVKRPEVIEKIKEARSQGDLSENAEYDAARNEQGMIESRILEIEQQLKFAKVIPDDAAFSGEIHLGSKVTMYDVEFDENIEYTLVGTSEADMKKHFISNESPIGKALLGKKAGDTVTVNAPSGVEKFKIISVK